MARKNRTKLITMDDECWNIVTQQPNRMQSVFVRRAIKHFHRWQNAGHTVPMIKDDIQVNRFDANTINLRTIELQDMLEAQTNRWNDAYVENIQLKKRLSKLEKEDKVKTSIIMRLFNLVFNRKFKGSE